MTPRETKAPSAFRFVEMTELALLTGLNTVANFLRFEFESCELIQAGTALGIWTNDPFKLEKIEISQGLGFNDLEKNSKIIYHHVGLKVCVKCMMVFQGIQSMQGKQPRQ